MRKPELRRVWLILAITALIVGVMAPAALADDPEDDGHTEDTGELQLPDRTHALEAHDALGDVISSEPSAKNVKNITLRGLGERAVAGATTDVWAHNHYAYTGTFNSPCSTPEAGVWVWDVTSSNNAKFVDVIVSETGDRTNDVKVATMNSGDILVMSNESCGGGNGGFEIYDVDDPTNPAKLASVTIDELNPISNALFGGISDVGVHNLFLFTQGESDYVAAVAETAFDNFMIFDITDPTSPTMVSAWGAEELFDPGVGDETSDVGRVLDAALWLLDGFGASANRFLHDITVTADGQQAYLANWDAGLVLMDISDPSSPSVVSVALDPANGSRDGEVNSHSVWPNEDGSIVVEGEEDFSAWEGVIPPSNLTLDGTATPGDPTIPATAISTQDGDDFEANQTGSQGVVDGSSVTVNSGDLAGNTYVAVELATAPGSPTFADTGPISGEFVWLGRACTLTQGDTLLNAAALDPGDIAVVRRGSCEFQEKADAAAAAGAGAVIIANNLQGTPWSGLRIWDYSDPTDPVLASIFDTECSASLSPGDNCDPAGTYSSHNVIVETTGNKVMAYVSWYSDGMLVIDVSDPYNPVEVGRYLDNSVNSNGEPNDFWGVYKVPNDPFFYGSDRNGGLYILKPQGSGSGK